MHHASARTAISRLLQGSGFGERAVTLVDAVALHDHPGASEALRRLALDRALALPDDDAVAYTGALNQQAAPSDERGLCAQLAPVIAAHPADVALGLSCLDALARLWPHVGTDERPLLRLRFLNTLMAHRVPVDGPAVTSAMLREWQRRLPTCFGSAPPDVVALRALLTEPTPELSYRVLAEHLGMEIDFRTLGRVLGALAVQVLIAHRDPGSCALRVLSGTVACERLADWTPPEHLATLISQLSHQLWWCRNGANLPPVRICLDTATTSLDEAVASGDITLAQRSARAVSREPARFWAAAWRLVDAQIAHDDRLWPSALAALAAVLWRTGAHAASPDDAGALGTVLADLVYRDKQAPVAVG